MKNKYLLSDCLKKNFKNLKSKVAIKTSKKYYTYSDLFSASQQISLFIDQKKTQLPRSFVVANGCEDDLRRKQCFAVFDWQ